MPPSPSSRWTSYRPRNTRPIITGRAPGPTGSEAGRRKLRLQSGRSQIGRRPELGLWRSRPRTNSRRGGKVRDGEKARGGGPAVSIRQRDDFAAGPRGEGGQDRVGGVAKEPDGAVGEEEVRAAGVQGPEVEGVALVVQPARGEVVRPHWAATGVLVGRIPKFTGAQHGIPRAGDLT